VGGRLLRAQGELSGLAPGNFARGPATVALCTPVSFLVRDLDENQVIAGRRKTVLGIILQ
jgi:hypothetical protein